MDHRIFYTLYVVGILVYMSSCLFIDKNNLFRFVWSGSIMFLSLVGATHILLFYIWS